MLPSLATETLKDVENITLKYLILQKIEVEVQMHCFSGKVQVFTMRPTQGESVTEANTRRICNYFKGN